MTRKIKPNNFIEAEELVTEGLKKAGWYIVQHLGYHTYFSQDARDFISKINLPTALYIRTLADRVAIRPTPASVLQVETKDHRDPQYDNIAIESFPMLIHRFLWWQFEIDCLYAFVLDDGIKACWVQDLHLFKIIIPRRLRAMETSYWLPRFRQFFPYTPIERKRTGGSGDPLGLIAPEELEKMKSLEVVLGEIPPVELFKEGREAPPAATATTAESGDEIERLRTNWRKFIREAPPELGRTPASALLRSATPKSIEGNTLVLSFKFPMHKENMEKPDNQQVAEKIISSFLGRSCRVRSVYEPEDNHLIEEALKMGARIIDAEEN